MKRILLAVLILGTIVLNSGTTQAQTRMFGGVNYDDEMALSGGIATPMFQSPIGEVWEFAYVNFGLEHYKSLTSEFALIRSSADKSYYGGVLLGGNGEWVGGENPVAYLVGASGFIGGWKKFYAYAKYKFALENGTLYPDGLAGGFGVHIGF